MNCGGRYLLGTAAHHEEQGHVSSVEGSVHTSCPVQNGRCLVAVQQQHCLIVVGAGKARVATPHGMYHKMSTGQ